MCREREYFVLQIKRTTDDGLEYWQTISRADTVAVACGRFISYCMSHDSEEEIRVVRKFKLLRHH